jgi:hypothetical protein
MLPRLMELLPPVSVNFKIKGSVGRSTNGNIANPGYEWENIASLSNEFAERNANKTIRYSIAVSRHLFCHDNF